MARSKEDEAMRRYEDARYELLKASLRASMAGLVATKTTMTPESFAKDHVFSHPPAGKAEKTWIDYTTFPMGPVLPTAQEDHHHIPEPKTEPEWVRHVRRR